MTDEGDSPEEGTAGEEPQQPAAARSSRKPARDERDRSFERIEKVLYWVRRTRAAKLAPDRFLTPIDYLINLNMQCRGHRRAPAWASGGVMRMSAQFHPLTMFESRRCSS